MGHMTLLGCGKPPSSSFTDPSSISGLQFWYQSDQQVYSDAGTTLANDTDNVQQWNDLSSNGRNLSQGTSGNRPNLAANIQNGKAMVNFTAANSDFMDYATSFTVTNPLTFFLVIRPTGLSGTQVLIDEDNGSGTRAIAYTSGTTLVMNSGNNRNTGSLANNTSYCIAMVFNGGVESRYFINTVTASTTGDPGTSGLANGLRIGRQYNGSTPFAGYYGEVIGYQGALSDANVANVMNYLNGRWATF